MKIELVEADEETIKILERKKALTWINMALDEENLDALAWNLVMKDLVRVTKEKIRGYVWYGRTMNSLYHLKGKHRYRDDLPFLTFDVKDLNGDGDLLDFKKSTEAWWLNELVMGNLRWGIYCWIHGIPDLNGSMDIKGYETKKHNYGTTAFRVALGGICAAVCLLMMFSSSLLPGLSYAIPMFAGLLMVVMIVETDSRWALATYCAVSLLCMFITPNVEASLLFILFMGYYPILQYRLYRMKSKPLAWAIKLGVYNAAIVIYYNLFKFVFTSVDMLEDSEFFGKYALPALWVEAEILFFVYDRFVTVLSQLYIGWFRKRILRRK